MRSSSIQTPYVQVVTVAPSATSGTFTLTFNGQNTSTDAGGIGVLPFNATAAQVAAALNALPSVSGVGGAVSVTQTGTAYTVTFLASLGGIVQPLMAATGTGMPNPTVATSGGTQLQEVILSPLATSGSYTLTFNGFTSAPIAFNASPNVGAGSVQTILQNLLTTSGLGGTVAVTQSGRVYTVQFQNVPGTLSLMTAAGSNMPAPGVASAGGTPVMVPQGIKLLLSGTGGGSGAVLDTGGSNTLAGPIFMESIPAPPPTPAPGNTVGYGVQNVADSLTIAGVIGEVGPFGLQKVGPGTLILQNANTYSGTTSVGAGAPQSRRGRHPQDREQPGPGCHRRCRTANDHDQRQHHRHVHADLQWPDHAAARLRLHRGHGAGGPQRPDLDRRCAGRFRLGEPADGHHGLHHHLPGQLCRLRSTAATGAGAGGTIVTPQHPGRWPRVRRSCMRVARSRLDLGGLAAPLPMLSGEALLLNGSGAASGIGALDNLSGTTTFTGAPIILGSSSAIGVDGGTLTVAGDVSGPTSAALSKVGLGKLIFQAPHSYLGQTLVLNGVLNTSTGLSLGENAVPEIQHVVVGGSGTFQLGFGSPITYYTPTYSTSSPPTASVLQGDLDALPSIGGQGGYVLVSGSPGNYTITFEGSLDGSPQPLIQSKVITGSPTVTVTEQQAGSSLINEQQTVSISGTAGTFTLTFNGQTTGPLAFNAPANPGNPPFAPPFTNSINDVESALNALPTIGGVGGSVTVTQVVTAANAGVIYTITFGGSLADQNVPQITAAGQGGVTVAVNTLVTASGANTPWSGETQEVQQITAGGSYQRTLTARRRPRPFPPTPRPCRSRRAEQPQVDRGRQRRRFRRRDAVHHPGSANGHRQQLGPECECQVHPQLDGQRRHRHDGATALQ